MPETRERLRAALADRYHIERELGQGGMATVHLAEDLKHRRRVAIKVLRPELAASLGAERFLREIEIAAGLAHPHILPLFDSGAVPGDGGAPAQLYYVMPFLEGESLRERLRRERRLPLGEALRLATEAGDALAFAHARGLVHRDIKPENILLQGGHAVVADFGIARAVTAAGAEHLTQTGLAIGTPAYMSPEQAAGDPSVDARSDVYSLGCVLHEMLTGEPPFRAPTAQAMLTRRMTESVPTLRSHGVVVPEVVERAVAKALAPNAAERFQSAAEFVAALHPGSDAPTTPRRGSVLVAGGVALAAVILLLLWRPWRSASAADDGAGAAPMGGPVPASRLAQVTVREGVEEWPVWSPDGKRLLFVAADSGYRQLFVRDLATGAEQRLTSGRRDVIQPAWAPDGRRVAFARAAKDGYKLEVGDVLGTYQDTEADIWVRDFERGEERQLVRKAVNPAFSPDGRQLAFHASWGESRRLWIADSGGRNPQQLTTDSTESVEHASPQWSPDGKRIAFRRVQKNKSDIMVVDVASKATAWLTDDNILDLDPAWAPSGRAVYFSSSRGGGLNIWRVPMTKDGAPDGVPQQVTTGAGDDREVSVSPDGRHLAFTVLGVNSDVWRLPVDPVTGRATGAPQTLVATTRVESRASWAPDGRQIAFNSDRLGDMNIWLRSLDDGSERQLTSGPGGDYQPDWSPDGTTIVFFSARGGNSDIWTVSIADGALTQLTRPPGTQTNPFYSPDGRQIAFHSDREGRVEVWVMNADGSGQRRLTSVGTGGHFVRWTKDGRGILMAGAGRTLRLDVATGATTELPHVSSGAHMSFSPDQSRVLDARTHRTLWVHPMDGSEPYEVYDVAEPDMRIDYPAWSPDGKWILFDHASPRGGDIWQLELLDR